MASSSSADANTTTQTHAAAATSSLSSGTLVIPQSLVPSLLPMDVCVSRMRNALRTLASGDAINPLRSMLRAPPAPGQPSTTIFANMPAFLPGTYLPGGVFGVKTLSICYGNHDSPFDSHVGCVLLFEAHHGRLLAIVDASSITAIRTAAVSAVATDLLALPHATELCLIGTGAQAHTHLEAMLLVRPSIARVRVFSRSHDKAATFVRTFAERHPIITFSATSTTEEAVRGAHIICTLTSSPTPVLLGQWLTPGAHINAVGACTPVTREVDTEAAVRSLWFCDRRESTLKEAGDFLIPLQEGAIREDHILAEIGDLLLQRAPGRTSEHDITLFKSLGLACEDVACAEHVWHEAVTRGLGTTIELGGMRV